MFNGGLTSCFLTNITFTAPQVYVALIRRMQVGNVGPTRSLLLFSAFTLRLHLQISRKVLSDISLRESWQPFYSKLPHYLPKTHQGRHTQRELDLRVCVMFIRPPGWRQQDRSRSAQTLSDLGERRLDEKRCLLLRITSSKKSQLATWPPRVRLTVLLGTRTAEDGGSLMASYSRLRSRPGQWAIRSKCWWLGGDTQSRPGLLWTFWTFMITSASSETEAGSLSRGRTEILDDCVKANLHFTSLLQLILA